ncbi:TfuA-like protein [Actinomycetes bacterium KLBMP 9759]
MSGAAVVFAGPSVSDVELLAAAPAGLEFEVRPPVRRGDLDALVREPDPPRFIGIVDGEFMQALMISPKEIVRIIDSGATRMFGSSSIGALRAVELAGLGMEGVGRVFELYRDGTVAADDEVAMVYDGETGRPLCEPMVNIRLAVADGVAAGVIDAATGDAAVRVAKALYYPDRNYRTVLRLLADVLEPARLGALSTYLLGDPPNAKRDDAVAMVQRMASEMAGT